MGSQQHHPEVKHDVHGIHLLDVSCLRRPFTANPLCFHGNASWSNFHKDDEDEQHSFRNEAEMMLWRWVSEMFYSTSDKLVVWVGGLRF